MSESAVDQSRLDLYTKYAAMGSPRMDLTTLRRPALHRYLLSETETSECDYFFSLCCVQYLALLNNLFSLAGPKVSTKSCVRRQHHREVILILVDQDFSNTRHAHPQATVPPPHGPLSNKSSCRTKASVEQKLVRRRNINPTNNVSPPSDATCHIHFTSCQPI